MRYALGLACSIVIFGLAGFGHDIALFPELRGDALVVLAKYGHPGDYQPALLPKLLELKAFDPAGTEKDCAMSAKSEGDNLVAQITSKVGSSGVWLFAARYDNGFYTKLPNGRTVNTTKLDAPAGGTVTHNFKFGKALFRAGAGGKGFDRIVGHRLELVPQSDPFKLKPGESFAVLVRFENKPLPGAGVEIGDGVTPMKEDAIPRFKTDAKGIAKVPVTKTGLQLIAVDYDVPSVAPTVATKDAYTATLIFHLSQ